MKRTFFILALFFSTLFAKPVHMIFDTPHASAGMFGTLKFVLGLLELYECKRWAGCSVDFSKYGLYYDPKHGLNWWEYYFEPINYGFQAKRITNTYEDLRLFSKVGFYLPRQRAIELVQKYIKIKPHILEKVAHFQEENFKAHFIIGVHYRGTDKAKENPRVDFEKMGKVIQNTITELNSEDYQIFLATDETAFLEYALTRFGDRLIYTESLRSIKGIPVHFDRKNSKYIAGEEAIIDCLLLASSDVLIRTPSNLSESAAYFNPELPVILVE